MTVPRLLVLTDRRRSSAAGRSLVETVAAAVDAGAPAVVLREKDLDVEARRRLAREVAEVADRADARLVIASDPALAAEVGAAGLHLAAADPACGHGPGWLVGRSCHDLGEVRAARAEGVDYVTASPAATSASKPGYGPALGRDGLAELVRAAGDLPVLALGGVTPADVEVWSAAGAHGVAVMGGVMGADDPAAAVRALLERLPEAVR